MIVKSYKLNRILLGVLVFICTTFMLSVEVFAGCASYKNYHSCRANGCNWKQGTCYGSLKTTTTTTTTTTVAKKTVHKFYGNGGTVNGYSNYSYTCTSTSCSYNVPTAKRDGYIFKGWSMSGCVYDDIYNDAGQQRTVKQGNNLSYYACWEEKKPASPSPNPNPPSPAPNPPSSSTKYNITFGFDNGYYTGTANKLCSSPLLEGSDKCYATNVSSGTKVSIPSKELIKGDYKLLGYTKDNCVSSEFVSGSTVTVNSNIEYTACYQDNIKGYMVANKTIKEATTNKEIYDCGQHIYINYCVIDKNDDKQYCFDSNNNKILESSLSNLSEESKLSCSPKKEEDDKNGDDTTPDGKKYINSYMYATKNIKSREGESYACGTAIWIEYSVSDNGYFYKNTKNKNDQIENFKNLTSDKNSLNCQNEVISEVATKTDKYMYMYTTKDVTASNGVTYKCGDKIWIETCSNNVCTFDISSKKYTIDETALAYTSDGLNCTVKEDNSSKSESFNYFNYMRTIKNGVKDSKDTEYKCGQDIYITSCDKDNCYFYTNGENDVRAITRSNLTQDLEFKCSGSEIVETDTKYTTIKGSEFSCGEQIRVYNCENNICEFKTLKNENGIINKNNFTDKESNAQTACAKVNVTDSKYVCSATKYTNQEGTSLVTLCYDEDDSEASKISALTKIYKCNTSDGYNFNEREAFYVKGTKSCTKGKCAATYSVTCSQDVATIKPNMDVTSGMVGSDGYGEIKVKAYSKTNKIVAYYVSEEYITPSNKVSWIKINSSSFTIRTTPGVKYIWVKDDKNNISNVISAAVLDNVNSNTTLSKLELRDGSGVIQNANRVSYNDSNIVNSKYALLSNNLGKDSKVLADGFNPFDMEYKLEVSSPTISVYATLTSTDSSYVDGYEPRTVNLNYGVNTILIKIKNNEGKIRTYTIIVTRTDDRNADNTLNDIKLSVGNINFNSNVTDYKIEIPKNTKSVDVASVISSSEAKYVEGYEPGKVNITGDTTIKLIKVMSQTGTTRTYVLTFVKEGTDVINEETLQINNLVIPGAYFSFEKGIANYSTTVGYETETVDIRIELNDETSTYSVGRKQDINGDYVYGSNLGVGLEVGENFIIVKVTNSKGETTYYRITVIRKEFGLEVEKDYTLKDLKVLGYDIKFNPNEKEYTVRIKQEKSLVITAVPNSTRAEVFIRGNDELTGFSTVRVKVVAENGEFTTYSIDIKKDAFNKVIEIGAIIVGTVIILGASAIIVIKRKNKSKKDYIEE